MVSVSRRSRGYLSIVFVLVLLVTGCASPHTKALRQYAAGDPAQAEGTLEPLLAKKDKNAVLYLLDIGMFRFAQGNCMYSNKAWMKSGELADYEPGALETGLELFKSDAKKRFIGDPVEHSMAFLCVGLGYYMMKDYENATVAFKKSLEWDYSGDVERQGDMVITNLMLGECFARNGESDQAIVAYRKALRGNREFVPAYVGLCRELEKTGETLEAEKQYAELRSLVTEDYSNALDRCQEGVLVIIMSGSVPKVKKDAFVGAFRQRSEVSTPINDWLIEWGDDPDALEASHGDAMITHLKDQGGVTGQAIRKGAQVCARECLPLGRLLIPSTEADVRYWSTLPGDVYVAYVPLEPGLHTIRATARNKNGDSLDNYRQTWHYIPVAEGENTPLVIISHNNLQKLM
ncbi:MAG: tetratricopeptide repeat protein [Candidatus Latescibacterota bacterium]|nr:MAG: tetratricopeptide repeat protein [Candidatus Latescibacterota bacterium]